MMRRLVRPLRLAVAAVPVLLLIACSSGTPKPKPAELPPNNALVGVRLAWNARIGEVAFPLDARVAGNTVGVASADGTVAVLDAASGREQWRASAEAPKLSSGEFLPLRKGGVP